MPGEAVISEPETNAPAAGKSGRKPDSREAVDIAREHPPCTLRLAEEIMLLLLDEAGGAFNRIPALQRDYALAGSVVLDLTLESRIDTDPERLFVIDPEPVEDDLLDPMLARIVQSSETHDAGHWIRQAVTQANDTFEGSVGRLVERGILDRKERRFLGIRRRSRYAIADATAAGEPKQRVLRILSDTDIPDVRSIVLISLADACGILENPAVRPGIPFGGRADQPNPQSGSGRPIRVQDAGCGRDGVGHPRDTGAVSLTLYGREQEGDCVDVPNLG